MLFLGPSQTLPPKVLLALLRMDDGAWLITLTQVPGNHTAYVDRS